MAVINQAYGYYNFQHNSLLHGRAVVLRKINTEKNRE
jgi:hypothetical protein